MRNSDLVTISILTWVLGLRFVSAHCAYGTADFPREPQVPISTFGYDYLKGPLNWFGLNETANILCDTGKNQSPIVLNSSIATATAAGLSITIADYPDGAEFENLGTNVEVVVNGTLAAIGKNFSLAQFHFHTPSEHRIEDEFYPLEIHFVFQAADKQYAVLAALIDVTDEAERAEPFLESVFSSVVAISQPGNATLTGPLHFGGFLSRFESVWTYTGSLTTPPCSENVAWFINQSFFYVKLSTWKAVKKVVKFNARYTQDNLGNINLLQNAGEELAQTSHLRRR